MKIRKKNGTVVMFNPDNIKLSVERASDEVRQPMNEADLKAIARQVEEQARKEYRDEVTFRAVHMMVLYQLRTMGFTGVAAAYDAYHEM